MVVTRRGASLLNQTHLQPNHHSNRKSKRLNSPIIHSKPNKKKKITKTNHQAETELHHSDSNLTSNHQVELISPHHYLLSILIFA